jgi:leucyl/phenylalanyl-tRNA--protein transferase
MAVYMLNSELVFPDPQKANPDGLLAVGGDLTPTRLLLAYESGIFPWFSPPDPLLWWSPDPRCVIFTDKVKVSKSMRNVLNRNEFEITYDQDFLGVMSGCRSVERPGQDGTWITSEILEAYSNLHDLGMAHSVEAWYNGELVGGLYGVSIGKMFCGESMFANRSNASKVALIYLCRRLSSWGFELIDCQIYNDHLGSMGAQHISRAEFLKKLDQALEKDSIIGNWGDLNTQPKES